MEKSKREYIANDHYNFKHLLERTVTLTKEKLSSLKFASVDCEHNGITSLGS
jgi:hypothetical protein